MGVKVMTGTVCVFVVDSGTFASLESGTRPRAPFSHDLNLLHLAQEAARLGQRVSFLAAGGEMVQEVRNLFPSVTLLDEVPLNELEATRIFVFAVSPRCLSQTMTRLPKGSARQGVLVVPAIQWLEAPELMPRDYLDELREAVIYDIDQVICQNQAMAELFASLATLAGGSMPQRRILVAPCGFPPEDEPVLNTLAGCRDEIRREMDVASANIAIINAGGVWRWTDLDVFLDAFVQLHRERPGNRLVFFIMGLRQQDNSDHEAFVAGIREKIANNQDLLVSGALRIIDDWHEAGALLPRYIHGADLGVNVSKRTIEHAQSFRQRFVEYARACLPVINTEGDPMSLGPFRSQMLCVEAGTTEPYLALFRKILEDSGSMLAGLREEAKRLRSDLRTDKNYGPLLTQLGESRAMTSYERQALIDWFTDSASFASIKARRGSGSNAKPILRSLRRCLNLEERRFLRERPELQRLDDTAFLYAVYQHFLFRAPDTVGLATYLAQLKRNGSRVKVVRAIATSNERRSIGMRPGR